MVAAAKRCVEAAWRGERGFAYVKAGVMLGDLCRADDAPPTLFDAAAPRSEAMMAAMDQVNRRFGRGMLFPAAMGIMRG